MNQVILKTGKDKRVRGGHLWVYQGEIGIIGIGVKPGDVVEVLDNRGRFLGMGYYNNDSQIAVRLLDRDREPINEAFFRKRIGQALAYRKQACPEATSYRLVYGEGDLLPGLVVDRFEDYLAVQFLTLGIEVHRETIIKLLIEFCNPRGIVERSDLVLRYPEEAPGSSRCVFGNCPDMIEIMDNRLKFKTGLLRGEQIGYNLDQSANRAVLQAYAKSRAVLDCFCHNGSFAVHAAAYGARSVLGVDISAEAVKLAEENAALNGFGEVCRFKVSNTFDFLRDQVTRKPDFDMIILDTPAFTQSKQTLERAIRGYKELNLRAMKILPPGGILMTCSGSFHMDAGLFGEIINTAAVDAKKRIRLLERRTQGLDHPILIGVPETEYLKCWIFEVVE